MKRVFVLAILSFSVAAWASCGKCDNKAMNREDKVRMHEEMATCLKDGKKSDRDCHREIHAKYHGEDCVECIKGKKSCDSKSRN